MSLLDQLGGEEQLEALIALHNQKAIADKRLSRFFEGVDMVALSHKQKAFLQRVFGDATEATIEKPWNLNAAHARLRSLGLNDVHVDAIFESFADSLTEFGASPEQADIAIAKLETWRDVVMDRAPD